MELPYIASIKFKDDIDNSCALIKEHCGIDYFIIYILFKNRQLFVLSNTYEHLFDYYQNGMFKHDFSISPTLFKNKHYYVCENDKGISEPYSELLRNKYSVHRTFYEIFNTPEFDIILGAATKRPIKNKTSFYHQVKNDFCQFMIKFISNNLHIFTTHNPELKKSKYFNSDIMLRKIFLDRRSHSDLTFRELECLKLTAKGFTATEIANLLHISKHTVEEYKKLILKKLNAVNMPNAIYLAMAQSLLNDNHQLLLPNANTLIAFRNIIQNNGEVVQI